MDCAKVVFISFCLIYVFLMSICFLMSGLALFTSSWVSKELDDTTKTEWDQGALANFGLWDWTCGSDKQQLCDDWLAWYMAQPYTLTIKISMCIGVILAGLASVFGMCTMCSCWCGGGCCMSMVLGALTTGVDLSVALYFFMSNTMGDNLTLLGANVKDPDPATFIQDKALNPIIGYSLWLALYATAAAACSVVIGLIAGIVDCYKYTEDKKKRSNYIQSRRCPELRLRRR